MVDDVIVFVDWIPLDIQVLFGSEMRRTISLKMLLLTQHIEKDTCNSMSKIFLRSNMSYFPELHS